MKSKKRKLFVGWIIIIVIASLILYVWANMFRNYYIYNLKKKAFDEISHKIKEEQDKKENIERKKEMYKDDENIKKQILKKNKLKRPGEEVIEFID
jgi:chromatin remodeling complex protein RSC6